jgi:hypothetical protein
MLITDGLHSSDECNEATDEEGSLLPEQATRISKQETKVDPVPVEVQPKQRTKFLIAAVSKLVSHITHKPKY